MKNRKNGYEFKTTSFNWEHSKFSLAGGEGSPFRGGRPGACPHAPAQALEVTDRYLSEIRNTDLAKRYEFKTTNFNFI